MTEPRELAEKAERYHSDDAPDRERFNGFGVMGLPFASGHILGLRRFPASSIGPAYSSVWHRDPDGAWTFYSDVEPLQSCNRFFGAAVESFVRTEIAIKWTAPNAFTVEIPGQLIWDVGLKPTAVTRLMNAIGAMMPESFWTNKRVLTAMGMMASTLLGAGKLRLYGRVPNGQSFIANPRLIWTIPSSRALLAGKDLGMLGPVSQQATLGDFAIPQRGIFTFGNASFEPFDAARHSSAVSKSQAQAAPTEST
ncbi:MAG: hypothetical protein ACE5FA_02880 [Dehalococcoidia bacterium]